MNTTWQEFLATRGAQFDQDSVADFGNPMDELVAAQQATVVVPLQHLALIECAGDDAKSFLHNQLTSDVNHLDLNAAQHSAWCTHKGRMQASFVLYRRGADYRALLSADLLDATLKRLQIFVLRSKVKLSEISGSQIAVGIAGPNAADALRGAGLGVPEAILATTDFAAGTVIRLDLQRFILIADANVAPTYFGKLAAVAKPAGTPVWRWLDIQAGLVLVTAATKEEFVPQMANLDKIGGVSFHKGCYPGQEVVARARYLGKIKRHLYRIHTDAPILAGTSIFQAENREQPCGLVATVAPAPGGGFAALAVIKESVADSDDVSLEIPGVAITGIESTVE